MSDIHNNLNQYRAALSQRDGKIYLNTGITGPLSAAAKLAVSDWLFAQQEKNGYLAAKELAEKAQGLVARLIGAEPGEIALKNSTTHGIYEAIFSLDWSEGDEAVISNREHHAVIRPLLRLRERYGIVIRFFETQPDAVASLSAQLSSRTKLVAFSHVSYITGERLPAKELIAAAHERGVPVVIDGAQSAGAIPLDARDMDVDYYSLPGQKWLFGPQGTGALYVAKRIVDAYKPITDDETLPEPYQDEKLSADIQRYAPAPPSALAVSGFAASLEWLLDTVGLDGLYGAIADISAYAISELSKLDGITVITPEDSRAGLVSFRSDARPAKDLLERLKDSDIHARLVPPLDYVRLSLAFFIRKEDVDRLVEVVRGFVAGDDAAGPVVAASVTAGA
ncbi:MAG: aminotransferase class V-fold PLP-dependent enzyme [Oscillospiraceae bacterium]|jgi:L-cysteine/cystine lyase|nr:aminotransferase class V-fold PLP-dependent enzyme [Oscillospiraceae bacterium]